MAIAVAVFVLFLFFPAPGSGGPGGLGFETELGCSGRCCCIAASVAVSFPRAAAVVSGAGRFEIGRHGAVACVSSRPVVILGVRPRRVDGGKDTPSFGRAGRLHRVHPSPAQGRRGASEKPCQMQSTSWCLGNFSPTAMTSQWCLALKRLLKAAGDGTNFTCKIMGCTNSRYIGYVHEPQCQGGTAVVAGCRISTLALLSHQPLSVNLMKLDLHLPCVGCCFPGPGPATRFHCCPVTGRCYLTGPFFLRISLATGELRRPPAETCRRGLPRFTILGLNRDRPSSATAISHCGLGQCQRTRHDSFPQIHKPTFVPHARPAPSAGGPLHANLPLTPASRTRERGSCNLASAGAGGCRPSTAETDSGAAATFPFVPCFCATSIRQQLPVAGGCRLEVRHASGQILQERSQRQRPRHDIYGSPVGGRD